MQGSIYSICNRINGYPLHSLKNIDIEEKGLPLIACHLRAVPTATVTEMWAQVILKSRVIFPLNIS